MKAIKLFAIGLMGTSLLLSACKKDEVEPAPAPSGSTNLTGKDWRATSITLNTPGVPTVDIFAAMDPCEKDDLIEFLTTGLVTLKAGASKCNTEPDTEPGGSWALLNSDKTLRIIDGDTTLMDVVELSASTLKLKASEVDAGVTYTTNYTFTKN